MAALEIFSKIHALSLFIGLHFSALSVMLAITFFNLKGLLTSNKLSIFLLLRLFAFRIAYFPVMVLAASIACYSEWLLFKLAIDQPIKIFPAFFISVGIFFTFFSYLLLQAVKGTKSAIILLIVLGFTAMLISFSSADDFTLLPDKNWSKLQHLPEISYPQQNPSISRH